MIHHSTWNFRHFHMRSLQVSSKRQQGHQSSCHNYTNHRSKGRRKCNRSRHRGKSLGYNRTLVVRSRNLLIRHRYNNHSNGCQLAQTYTDNKKQDSTLTSFHRNSHLRSNPQQSFHRQQQCSNPVKSTNNGHYRHSLELQFLLLVSAQLFLPLLLLDQHKDSHRMSKGCTYKDNTPANLISIDHFHRCSIRHLLQHKCPGCPSLLCSGGRNQCQRSKRV